MDATEPIVLLALAIGTLITSIPQAQAIEAYDCTQGKPNITSISLIDVANCDLDNLTPQSRNVYIQLLQKVEHEKIFVQQCKILGHRRIRSCGAFSLISDVAQGDQTFIRPITPDECFDLIKYGQFKYGETLVDGLLVNHTTRQSITLAGTLKDTGECCGTPYVHEGREYLKAVVTVDLEVTLQEFSATLDIAKNLLHLPSGETCDFLAGKCFTSTESYASWEVTRTPTCNYQAYESLFQGMAVKVTENITVNPDIYFANSTGNIQFGLAKAGEFNLCGYKIFSTEHPKLFIVETSPGMYLPAKQRVDVEDILLSAYFNTKMTYFARHVKTQFAKVYTDIIYHRCLLERQVIFNSLSLIASVPDEFALNVMKNKGFTAIAAGEVAHIIQCLPVKCKVRPSQECYNELPVVCEEKHLFLRPKTRILTSVGTHKDCSQLLPSLFKINENWRSFPNNPNNQEPAVLHPMKALTWKYQDLNGLMSDGIYTPDDLNRLHEHIVFPMERPSLLENVARKLSDRQLTSGNLKLRNLLDKNAVEEMAQSAFAKTWNGFLKFGSAAAGFIAVALILQIIKAAADALIRGYAIYKVYGWSVHLLGALWSSITHLVLNLTKSPRTTTPTDNIDLELGTMPRTSMTQPADQTKIYSSTMPRPTKSQIKTNKETTDDLVKSELLRKKFQEDMNALKISRK